MKQVPFELSIRIIEELGEALKMFGTYSFDDKGSSEVMNLHSLVKEIRKLPAQEAAEVLFEVAVCKKHKGRGLKVASDIVVELQDWDELFTIPGIVDLLDGDPPGKPKQRTPVRINASSAADIMKKLVG